MSRKISREIIEENEEMENMKEMEEIETEETENDEEGEVTGVDSEGYIPPLKAIRQKCLDCCGNQSNEVKLCPCKDCTLWPYRFGKNPFRKKRQMSEEQRTAFAERVKKAREAKG